MFIHFIQDGLEQIFMTVFHLRFRIILCKYLSRCNREKLLCVGNFVLYFSPCNCSFARNSLSPTLPENANFFIMHVSIIQCVSCTTNVNWIDSNCNILHELHTKWCKWERDTLNASQAKQEPLVCFRLIVCIYNVFFSCCSSSFIFQFRSWKKKNLSCAHTVSSTLPSSFNSLVCQRSCNHSAEFIWVFFFCLRCRGIVIKVVLRVYKFLSFIFFRFLLSKAKW